LNGQDRGSRRSSAAPPSVARQRGLHNVAPSKRSKPAGASAPSELQIIEQFGRPLGIQDIATLRLLQTASRHVVFTRSVARGRSEVRYECVAHVLLTTRQPLLDTARLLLKVGCRTDAIIARRRLGGNADDMRAALGVAARLTVDETRTLFVTWKPFCQAAVQATEAVSGVSGGRVTPTGKSSGQRGRRRANRVQPEYPNPQDDEPSPS
jgi:hypothetical protein